LALRNDYLQAAQNVIEDQMILINVVSKRVKQFKFGERPLIVSLERLEPEDIAFREIIEGK
jgi:DNA-directed RNA polymerase subunit omega